MRTTKEKWLAVVVAAWILCFATSPAKAVQIGQHDLTAVVARINGVDLYEWELSLSIAMFQNNLFNKGRLVKSSEYPALREKILENIIERLLILQEAEKQGVSVKENAVDDKMWEFLKLFPSQKHYLELLEDFGLTEEQIRFFARRGLVVNKYLDQKFDAKAEVSDAEARQFYDNTPDSFTQPPVVKVRHILIRPEDGSKVARKKAKKKAKKILKNLRQGAEFAPLAREVSDCPSSGRGGDLGYLAKGDLEKSMLKSVEDMAFSLSIGQVSGIVESKYGYHIVEVMDKRPETLVLFEQVKDDLKSKMKAAKKDTLIDNYGINLKAGAKVERFSPK